MWLLMLLLSKAADVMIVLMTMALAHYYLPDASPLLSFLLLMIMLTVMIEMTHDV